MSTTYRRLWLATACSLAGVGMAVTCFTMPLSHVLGAGTLGAVLGGGFLSPAYQLLTGLDTLRPRHIGIAAACGAMCLLAIAGTIQLIGPMAIALDALVALVLAVTSPRSVHWYLENAGRPVVPPADDLEQIPSATRGPADDHPAGVRERTNPPAPSADLTVEELCRAWRTSYAALKVTDDIAGRSQIAGVRHAYLDELERRDPSGFRQWMDAGARAGSDPARFLTHADDERDEPGG